MIAYCIIDNTIISVTYTKQNIVKLYINHFQWVYKKNPLNVKAVKASMQFLLDCVCVYVSVWACVCWVLISNFSHKWAMKHAPMT